MRRLALVSLLSLLLSLPDQPPMLPPPPSRSKAGYPLVILHYPDLG